MARSCGIRLGPRRYEIVVLDGSPKKHKIAAFKADEFDPHAADPFDDAARVLKEAAKSLGVPRENVGLVIDSGHAAFRRLALPFSDTQKIEQVLKYEVESQLPQWNIDDVVVDYHALAENEASSDLLVSAVPKDDVQAALDVCARAGIEPFEAELETSAMVNAAYAAEICNIDDAQLLVHIGDYSTSVVVMDAGEVREMRVIHIGALTHEVPPPPPPEPEGDEAEGEESAEAAPPAPIVDPIEAARRVEQAIKRIRRELGRTISGARTVNPIEAIYVCGMELPGLVGSSVLDVPVYVLDCFEEDGGQPADGFGSLVVAYGAALRELGGGLMKPRLRREELRYTGTWERIEFPLAVACLLLATMLGVIFILQQREMQYQDINGVRFWLRSSNNFMIGNPKKGNQGNLYPPPENVKEYAARFADGVEIDTSVDPYDALKRIDAMLRTHIHDLKKELGEDASIEQPQSALVGAHLVLEVLEQNQKEWRPSLRMVQAVNQPKRGNRPESVKVTMDIVFLADDQATATANYEAFRQAIGQQYWFQDWPLENIEPLESGHEVDGISIVGADITVNVDAYYKKQRAEAEAKVKSK